MIRVAREILIEAEQQDVFEYVANYRNTLRFMHKIRRFEPRGGTSYGLGAQFYWETVVRGFKLGWEFVVTDFLPHNVMLAKGQSVPRSLSRWQFQPVGGCTLTTFEVGYDLPRVLLPKFVGEILIEREIGNGLSLSLRNLKTQVEAMAPSRRRAGARA